MGAAERSEWSAPRRAMAQCKENRDSEYIQVLSGGLPGRPPQIPRGRDHSKRRDRLLPESTAWPRGRAALHRPGVARPARRPAGPAQHEWNAWSGGVCRGRHPDRVHPAGALPLLARRHRRGVGPCRHAVRLRLAAPNERGRRRCLPQLRRFREASSPERGLRRACSCPRSRGLDRTGPGAGGRAAARLHPRARPRPRQGGRGPWTV